MKHRDKTVQDRAAQVVQYAQRCGAGEAHLVIFNRDPTVRWDEKVWQEERQADQWVVGVWGN